MSAISMGDAAQSGLGARFRLLIGALEMLRRFRAKFGLYVLLELLLPGGTMFALLLFLYQRWKLNAGSLPAAIESASPPALVSPMGRGPHAWQANGKGEERSSNAPLGVVRCACARA